MQWSILIVDDEPDNLHLLHQILKDKYKLYFSKTGEDAIDLAIKVKPHLILLDVMMPKMDGYEVCKILKSNSETEAIPVIFVTALNDVKDEQAGFNIGAVDYITKPVSSAIVKVRVKNHLNLFHQKLACEAKVKERTLELHQTRLKIIQKLGRAAEYKDNETGLHVVRMSYYSKAIALGLGWSDKESELLFQAAPMHDVGKIGIADSILTKPDKLNTDEWSVMRSHPEIGAAIIGEAEEGLLGMARTISLSHHEKWDGSGYPYGLSGNEIPIEGRIVAVADVFDALTTIRPYKKAWSVAKATELIRETSGHHFDPEVVNVFFDRQDEILDIKSRCSENKSHKSVMSQNEALFVSTIPDMEC